MLTLTKTSAIQFYVFLGVTLFIFSLLSIVGISNGVKWSDFAPTVIVGWTVLNIFMFGTQKLSDNIKRDVQSNVLF